MKHRILTMILIVSILIIPLSGCWDYNEFEQYAPLFSMGIDYNNDTKLITVTIQHLSTEKGSKGEKTGESTEGAMHSAEGESFLDALIKLQQVVVKKMFFGYVQIIIVNEDAARYIMKDLLDVIDRSPLIRNSAYLVITQRRAEDVISTVDKSYSISSSLEIYNLLISAEENGYSFPMTVTDFLRCSVTNGMEPAISRLISVYPKGKKSEADLIEEDGIAYDKEVIGDQRIMGAAVFKGYSFRGYLNAEESIGLSLIRGKNLHMWITEKIADSNENWNKLFFKSLSTTSKIKVDISGDLPEVDLSVDVKARLVKYDSGQGKTYITEKINEMQGLLNKRIQSYIESALQKGQKQFNSDIFGFGYELYRWHPSLWNKKYKNSWGDYLPDIPVRIKVNTKIVNTGSNMVNLYEK
jgi:spore germination protein KC